MCIIIRICVLFLWIHALTFVKSHEIKCSVPDIEHGRVTGEIRDYQEDEILHFECERRYNKQTDRPSKCVKIGASAEFSPTPVCESTTCTLSLSGVTGTRYDTTKNRFLPEETVGVMCSERHWISTPQTTSIVSTCTESGEWDILPVCQEATCSVEEPLVYRWSTFWRRVIRLGDIVGYWCQRGYRSTSSQARCTRDGWSPNPLCKVQTCNRFEVQHADIVENDKQTYEYGETVRYSCQEEGYDGVFNLTCQEQNRWSGDTECREKGCTRIDIPHAFISNNNRGNYNPDEMVEYTCENDWDRSFRVTCNKGNWTGIQTCPADMEAPWWWWSSFRSE